MHTHTLLVLSWSNTSLDAADKGLGRWNSGC